MKKAIKYTRFSSDGQSSFSIERQDQIIDHWAQYNKVQVIDQFTDEGYTARTFDRPDIKQLFSFIQKHHHRIDYLLVAELTRFSRETGDAINMVKKIQREYNIKIGSCSRGVIYDCTDPNSFFMMGLEFLLGHSENIKRQNDINGGIYAAKTDGRWIQGGPAPFGYKKEGAGADRKLVMDETQAMVVRFIFDAFLHNAPDYVILQDVKKMGFTLTGNSSIKRMLMNPIYVAQQYVKPYKDLPGGMYPGRWPAIIDTITWQRVQDKLNYKPKTRISLADDLPLRGVLRCHCGKLLTGAPSRSGSGKWFNYYKCQGKGHNNISAIKAHEQLNEIFSYMSLPQRLIIAIRDQSEVLLEERQKENRKFLSQKKQEHDTVQRQLKSVEEKWINEQINFETYDRWHDELLEKRNRLSVEISQLSQDQNEVHLLLQKNLSLLNDLKFLYESAKTLQKQELIRQVFDNSLYYQNKVYRTRYIMPVFSHNTLELKQKKLLEVDALNANGAESPVRWR